MIDILASVSFTLRGLAILYSAYLLWKFSGNFRQSILSWNLQQKIRFGCSLSCFISLSANFYAELVRIYGIQTLLIHDDYLSVVDIVFNGFYWTMITSLVLAVADRYYW